MSSHAGSPPVPVGRREWLIDSVKLDESKSVRVGYDRNQTRGDALILGALKDIAEQREDGQLVHRAWWVSSNHVRTLRRRGARCMITLSNGFEVPVSRRRQQALINQFGFSATLT